MYHYRESPGNGTTPCVYVYVCVCVFVCVCVCVSLKVLRNGKPFPSLLRNILRLSRIALSLDYVYPKCSLVLDAAYASL